jgi:2-methylcitrate dehydratase PrpD
MITENLAHFVVETRVEDIPQEALKIAQRGITDCIGVTFPGSLEPQGEIIRGYVRKLGGAAESSIIGSDLKTSSYLAALANGTQGHALDYDDMGGFGHPSVVLAPAILATGERIEASGRDILVSYVIGFEVAACLRGPLWIHYIRGWHATDNFGSLGAAAAVGRLLKLDVHKMRMALGIAASLAGGLRQNFGTMTKPLHAGQAAANGIQAALLAQAGLTADASIIEAPLGFAKVFGQDEPVDWEQISRTLGKTFNITSLGMNGIATKPYPSCGCTHAGIDAALAVKEKYGVKSEDIAEVEMGTSPYEGQVLIHHRPKSGLEGKFSLEYTVARALHSGEVRLRHFTDEGVNEPAIKRLIERTKWVHKYPPPDFSKQRDSIGPQSVTVKLADGKQYSQEIKISKGTPQRPLTSEEVTGKYRDCASMVLSKENVDKSLTVLSKLAEVKNIREIMETVTKKHN